MKKLTVQKLVSIKDIKERRRAFLEDTKNFYNYNNRALRHSSYPHGGKFCVYSPTVNSPGCAIGRWAPKLARRKFDAVSVFGDGIAERLPVWMIEMGLDFLGEVQVLHDTPFYWNDTGLSDKGKKAYRRIVEEYCT